MKCPYQPGTVEYFAWWDAHFAVEIPAALCEMRARAYTETELGRTKHGHNFDNKEQRCDCGINQRDYVDDKSYPKSICPKGGQ